MARAAQKAPAKSVAPTAKARPPKLDILDKSKPHGIIQGDFHGAAFSQGVPERFYRNDGTRIYIGEAAPPPAAAVEDDAAEDEAEAPAADDTEEPEADGGDGEDVQVDDVNLTAWGRGLQKYRFAQVREAISARYSKVCTNEQDASDFLVEEGVITAAEAKAAGR